MKYSSSAEASAAFMANPRRRKYRSRRRPRANLVSAQDRITLDFARATVAECLDCVSARINDCHTRGVEPDHITNIAWQMLCEALGGPSR